MGWVLLFYPPYHLLMDVYICMSSFFSFFSLALFGAVCILTFQACCQFYKSGLFSVGSHMDCSVQLAPFSFLLMYFLLYLVGYVCYFLEYVGHRFPFSFFFLFVFLFAYACCRNSYMLSTAYLHMFYMEEAI